MIARALTTLALIMALPAAVQAETTWPSPAAVGKPVPVVVELFTSTNCPSCPAAEAKLNNIAGENPDLLVVTEHVDYWDGNAAKPDPHASRDYTERQYDYSNRLSERPGQVFTPQPVLDGQWVAEPPLWLNWEKALEQAKAAPVKAALALQQDGDALLVTLPKGLKGNHDLVLLGVEKDEKRPNLWRANGLNILPVNGATARVGAGDLPKSAQLLVLLQEAGGGAVRAVGQRGF